MIQLTKRYRIRLDYCAPLPPVYMFGLAPDCDKWLFSTEKEEALALRTSGVAGKAAYEINRAMRERPAYLPFAVAVVERYMEASGGTKK